MQARIFKPAKSAMQSGLKNTDYWRLEFIHDGSREIEPLMGWLSSSDMTQEVNLKFPTKEAAIRFAEKNNIVYEIDEPKYRKTILKSYADNFK